MQASLEEERQRKQLLQAKLDELQSKMLGSEAMKAHSKRRRKRNSNAQTSTRGIGHVVGGALTEQSGGLNTPVPPEDPAITLQRQQAEYARAGRGGTRRTRDAGVCTAGPQQGQGLYIELPIHPISSRSQMAAVVGRMVHEVGCLRVLLIPIRSTIE